MQPTDHSTQDKLRGRKIGKILWRMGKCSEEQLKSALVRQQQEGMARPVGVILVEMGVCKAEDIKEALAHQSGVEVPSRVSLPGLNPAVAAVNASLVNASRSGAVIGGPTPAGVVSTSAVMTATMPAGAMMAINPAPGSGEAADSKLKGRRLGKILWRLGKCSEAQLKQALVTQQQRNNGTPVGEILVEMGICTPQDIETALAAQAGVAIPETAIVNSGVLGARLPQGDAGHGPANGHGAGNGHTGDAGLAATTNVADAPSIEIADFNLDEILGINPLGGAKPGQGINLGGQDMAGGQDASSFGPATRLSGLSAASPRPAAHLSAPLPIEPGLLAKLKGRKLGKILWRIGKVNEEQLKEALVRQMTANGSSPIGTVLVEMGVCTPDDVRLALAAQRGVTLADVAGEAVEPASPAATSTSLAGDAPGEDGDAPGGPLDIAKLKGRKLGKILWRMGRVSLDQIKDALLEQKQTKNGMIGEILVRLGYCEQADVDAALAAQMGIETVDLRNVEIPPEVLSQINAQTANLYRVIPLEYQEKGKILKVALDSADNFQATDDLRTLFGFTVKPVIVDPSTMDVLLAKHYGESGGKEMDNILAEINTDEELARFQGRGESIDISDLQELVDAAPVKKLLNLVLLQAIKDKASDIHFEPFEDEFKMRYRVDGVLYEMVPPPKHIALALASRVKVMSNLDISERRLPQDGRIALTVHGRAVDLRVSVLPTMFGESVVMRVLDRSNVNLDLDKLGMREHDLRMFRQLIRRPNGIVIVTGPTGSGKTTTLYSALAELNDISTKLITCEDPVEYDIDGIIQVAINADVELTFARALRAILRQDPDVVLVGECRDLETASISVQAALTGHLVFTTLHTNDAPAAIARLLDMGVPPYLITAVIEGILAQRLVRRICQQCRIEYLPTDENLFELELRPDDIAGRTFYVGRGCDYCNNTGYKGRLGIHEIMTLDDDTRELIMKKASTNVIRTEARKRGMRNLRESGLLSIYDGLTTIEEVVKETVMEE